ERRNLVTHAGAVAMVERDPGLLVAEAVLSPVHLQEAEQVLWEELADLRRNGVTSRELEKARNQVEAHFVLAQETVEGQGRKLGHYEMMGDYRLSERYVAQLRQVEPDDLARAAARYLVPEGSSVVVYQPEDS
ncbi:MAG: insulinase family protein, partial [Candidatus Eremiobacterota bacterium]